MDIRTPSSEKMIHLSTANVHHEALVEAAQSSGESGFEPSPTLSHLATRNRRPTALSRRGSSSPFTHTKYDVLDDLENKMNRRNQEIYRPMSSRNTRQMNSRSFEEQIRQHKDDKVMDTREYMHYKSSKVEHERVMNEIAKNMSLTIDDYLAAEESIDAILGFSDEIYDAKSRPKHFDMLEEASDYELMDDDDNDEGGFEPLNEEKKVDTAPTVKSEEALQQELEDYLKAQEEELEYLTQNLSLN